MTFAIPSRWPSATICTTSFTICGCRTLPSASSHDLYKEDLTIYSQMRENISEKFTFVWCTTFCLLRFSQILVICWSHAL